jgi:hypothetical protein
MHNGGDDDAVWGISASAERRVYETGPGPKSENIRDSHRAETEFAAWIWVRT